MTGLDGCQVKRDDHDVTTTERCAAVFDLHRPQLGAAYPETHEQVRCEAAAGHLGEHHGRAAGSTGIAWPVVIECEGGCGRSTTDPDKWDPDAETGRVLCDACWDREHPVR